MLTLFDKKPSQKQRILNLLRDREWHHMRQLNDIAFRYSARIRELRQEGHVVGMKTKDGVNYYRLET